MYTVGVRVYQLLDSNTQVSIFKVGATNMSKGDLGSEKTGLPRLNYIELIVVECAIMILYTSASFISFLVASDLFSNAEKFDVATKALIEGNPVALFFSTFTALVFLIGLLGLFEGSAPAFLGRIKLYLIWEVPRIFSMVACVMTAYSFSMAAFLFRFPDSLPTTFDYDYLFFIWQGTELFFLYLTLSCFLACVCKGNRI